MATPTRLASGGICLPPHRPPGYDDDNVGPLTRKRGDGMLRILGSPKRLCNGMTRREMLIGGGLSLLGIGLSDYLRLSAAQAGAAQPRSFGRAKACILLYLYGSPSQLELADMKPDAPAEIRG